LPEVLPEGIEKYKNFAEMTRGGSGILRSCFDQLTGRSVVMKSLLPQFVDDEKEKRRLLREARVTAQLQHPNTVPVYEIGRAEEVGVYFTMKRISGENFFEILKRIAITDQDTLKEFPLKARVEVVINAALALSYAHARGVIHRDVKPENILYLSEGAKQIKLIDFGYAGVWTPERPLTGLCGTPDYVAPEVLSWYDDEENGTPYGKGSDLWSLGVLLYVILSGCSPFSADEEEAILELVAKAKYEFHEAEWSSISDGAKDLISKLLVVDPLQRLTMQQLLDHSWLKGSVAAAKASIEAAKKGGSKKGSSKAAGAPSAMVSAAQRTADGVAAEKPGELNPTVLQPGGGSKKGACCVIS